MTEPGSWTACTVRPRPRVDGPRRPGPVGYGHELPGDPARRAVPPSPTCARLFAKANEEKSGDRLAGLAAGSERERVAAKLVLADVTLGEIVDNPLIDPDATT